MKRAIIVLIFIAIFCGIGVAFQVLGLWAQIFFGLFPLFVPTFKQTLEDYLMSPYFITGVIIALISSIGIALSIKEKKILYIVVSGILNLISIVSIISNLACCS